MSLKKGKILTGIFGFSVFLLGSAVQVNAAETDFTTCVKQDECVLESDVTIDSTIDLTNDLILDLNGYTITSNVKTPNAAIQTSHTLTIKDSKGDGLFDASQGYAFYAYDGGTLILDSGEVKALDAPFTGNNTTGDMNFIVNGGTLTALQGAAIYMPGQVNLEINGGTLNGGINLRMGQVTINGGNIINNNPLNVDAIEDYYGYQGSVWLSDAIAIIGGTYTSDNAEYGNSLNLVINGGNFESKIGNALTIYAFGKVEQDMNLEINGGTFNGKEISVAIEDADSLGLKDYSNVKVEDYKKFDNNVDVSITSGTFNSNVESLLTDGYKVVETEGIYKVEANLVISTDDESVTFESKEPLPNDYTLVVEEEKLENEEEVTTSITEEITAILEKEEEKLLDSKLVATYDISVKDSNNKVVKLENGNYVISIKVTDEQVKGFTSFKVAYIDDDGKVAEIFDAILKDGVVTFETSHLSTYAIIGYNAVTLSEEDNPTIGDADEPTTPDTPEVPQTFDSLFTYVGVGVVSVVAIVGAVIYIKRKQTN